MPLPRVISPSAPRSSRAFTLVELLTVIAIIGVLAAIIIPVTGRVRSSAKTAKCASNIRQLAQAALLYAGDHRNVLPPTFGTPVAEGTYSTTAWWWELYPVYCSGAEVFSCPADDTGFTPAASATFTRNGVTLANGKVSYGPIGSQIGAADYKAFGKRLSTLSSPARMVMLMDYHHTSLRLSENWNANKPRWTSSGVGAVSSVNNEYPAYPHSEKANMAFVDGHVAAMTQRELMDARTVGQLWVGHVAP